MATIEVGYPLHGTHVQTTFTATGVFGGGGNLADITCDLMRGSVTVASGTVSSTGGNGWQAVFAGPLSPESYLTFVASIGGSSPDSDEQDKITVDSLVPLELNDLPPPSPAPVSATTTRTITLTGSHRPH